MQATREIYWNVGHGVVLPMYILTFITFAVMAWGFWRRLRVWRQGKALNRFDHYGLAGQSVCRRGIQPGGRCCASRTAESSTAFLLGFSASFRRHPGGDGPGRFYRPAVGRQNPTGTFYKGFSLVLDMAGIVAIFMLSGLFVRRFVIKPKGLETVGRRLRYSSLCSLPFSSPAFLVEGAAWRLRNSIWIGCRRRMDPDLARYSPVGLLSA